MENAERFPRAVGSGGKPARSAHRGSDGGFPRLSTARHFHGAPGPSTGLGAARTDAAHQVTLGALHCQSRFGVGLDVRELLERGQRHTGPQETLATRHFLEQLERRGPPQIDPAALAVGGDGYYRHRAGAVKVDVGIQMLAVKRSTAWACSAPIWTKPRCLRITAPFLASTNPLSPEW